MRLPGLKMVNPSPRNIEVVDRLLGIRGYAEMLAPLVFIRKRLQSQFVVAFDCIVGVTMDGDMANFKKHVQ